MNNAMTVTAEDLGGKWPLIDWDISSGSDEAIVTGKIKGVGNGTVIPMANADGALNINETVWFSAGVIARQVARKVCADDHAEVEMLRTAVNHIVGSDKG